MEILNFVESITLLNVVKLMLVVLLVVYTIFAYLMMVQVRSMRRAVRTKDDQILRALGIAHFVFACLVLFIAIVVL